MSERSIVIQLGSTIDLALHDEVIELNLRINQSPFDGFIESVPAYHTITVYYDPIRVMHTRSLAGKTPSERVTHFLKNSIPQSKNGSVSDTAVISIPVCYGGEFGPDLNWVADYHHTSPEEIIRQHCTNIYTVYMLGFVPGFPYMGKLPAELSTPRKETPRTNVEPGSVGIAGEQTGIYPFASPGGWQLIGKTPSVLFDPLKEDPTLFHPGDRIQFTPVSREEFYKLQPIAS